MKLDMEVMYVPQANIYQLRDMMLDWKKTTRYAYNCSYISAIFFAVVTLVCFILKEELYYVNIGFSLLFAVSGFGIQKSYTAGYLGAFLSFAASFVRVKYLPFESTPLCVAAVIAGLLALPFVFRLVYNYTNVYKELEKRNGFPLFIANTADLYADKIYLKTEKERGKNVEENTYKTNTQAAYNPFSSQEEIREEEFNRQQAAHGRSIKEPIVMNFDADEETRRMIMLTEAKRKAREDQTYTYGVTAFGKELVFAHNDLLTASDEEKRGLMWKWNNNVEATRKNFFVFMMLMLTAVMGSTLGSIINALFNFLIIIVFTMGLNYMKMGKKIGPVITIVGFLWSLTLFNNFLVVCLVIGAYVSNPGIIYGTIRFILNYKIYAELKTHDGFPSFIRTTADMYGNQIYMVEKRETRVKKDLSKFKYMDYDELLKESKRQGNVPEETYENTAWNAFNYIDEEKKGDENEG